MCSHVGRCRAEVGGLVSTSREGSGDVDESMLVNKGFRDGHGIARTI